MERRFWGRLRAGRTSRLFSAYIAVVLLTAIIGPGLAVYAAEEETTPTPPAEAPVADVVAPEVESPEAPPPSEGSDGEAVVPEVNGGEAAAPEVDVAALVDPELYEGNPPEEDGCYRTQDPTTTTYNYDGVNVEVTTRETSEGWVLDFESTAPVTKVTVKGGPDANIYTYDPAVMSDEGLHAPAVSSDLWPEISHVDFCFGEVEAPETGDLVIRKFEDLDEDGIWDEGEPTLAGWDFTVYNEQDVEIESGTTDVNGWLMFEGLPEGDVVVTETLQAGWNNTTDLSQTVTIVAGETTRVYFGNVRCVEEPETGNLVIRKFEDLNEDGTWDEGEPVLGGWFFTLLDSEGMEIDSGFTDENGWLMFEGLAEGEVTAVETLESGWINTTPLSQDITIIARATATLCFGNARQVEAPETGNLVVRKFEDLDEDGIWDEGEPLLEGWDFTVFNAQDVQIGSGTTDANGWIMFEGLPEGEVTVVETLETGWTNTTPLSQSTTIVGGETAFLFFGNVAEVLAPETGNVLIHKYLDDNANGVLDTGEQFLSGWMFVVRNEAGAVVATGSTNIAGELAFELPVGAYTVTETLIAGWTNTTALTQSFTVVAGQTAHVFFGNNESFLPFTPSPTPIVTPSEPFLPFTGGEYLALITAALASSIAGVALRRRQRR